MWWLQDLGSDLPGCDNGSGMGKLEINSGIYMKVGSIPEKDEHSNYNSLELGLDKPRHRVEWKQFCFDIIAVTSLLFNCCMRKGFTDYKWRFWCLSVVNRRSNTNTWIAFSRLYLFIFSLFLVCTWCGCPITAHPAWYLHFLWPSTIQYKFVFLFDISNILIALNFESDAVILWNISKYLHSYNFCISRGIIVMNVCGWGMKFNQNLIFN